MLFCGNCASKPYQFGSRSGWEPQHRGKSTSNRFVGRFEWEPENAFVAAASFTSFDVLDCSPSNFFFQKQNIRKTKRLLLAIHCGSRNRTQSFVINDLLSRPFFVTRLSLSWTISPKEKDKTATDRLGAESTKCFATYDVGIWLAVSLGLLNSMISPHAQWLRIAWFDKEIPSFERLWLGWVTKNSTVNGITDRATCR